MKKVYSCRPSFEDDRPMIDFELPSNRGIDWLAVGEVVDGTLPRESWPVDIAVTVQDRKATEWDGYLAPGSTGIYSRRFVDVVGEGLSEFSLFPASVNGAQYFFLRCERPVDCFDRSTAKFKTYSHDPTRIMRIFHFAFTNAVPTTSKLFGILETLQLLATEVMVERIRESGCRGIFLEPLP